MLLYCSVSQITAIKLPSTLSIHKNIHMRKMYISSILFIILGFNVNAQIFEVSYDSSLKGEDFYRTEHVLYRGSQIHSFDAVFGGYDDAGNRIRLVNSSLVK